MSYLMGQFDKRENESRADTHWGLGSLYRDKERRLLQKEEDAEKDKSRVREKGGDNILNVMAEKDEMKDQQPKLQNLRE